MLSLTTRSARRAVRVGRRRANLCRNETTSSSTSATSKNAAPVTVQDLQSLRDEVKALQQLIREQKSQSYHVESLTRSVSAQGEQLERRLQSIESHVSKISGVEQIVSGLRDFVQHNPASRLVLDNLENVVNRSSPFVKQHKYSIMAALAALVVVWKYRSKLFYERTSEEVADLARMTLEQEPLRASIQETLQTVANNPSTLQTLNELVEKLITHERTEKDLVNLLVYAVNTPEVQEALLDLLQVVFKDPYLQQLTGEFLLKGLDMDNVKEMLDAQTQELVKETVSDDSVQQATAVGVQRALWYAVTPSLLWRFIQHDKKENDNTQETTVKGTQEDKSNDEGSSSVEIERSTEGLPSQ